MNLLGFHSSLSHDRCLWLVGLRENKSSGYRVRFSSFLWVLDRDSWRLCPGFDSSAMKVWGFKRERNLSGKSVSCVTVRNKMMTLRMSPSAVYFEDVATAMNQGPVFIKGGSVKHSPTRASFMRNGAVPEFPSCDDQRHSTIINNPKCTGSQWVSRRKARNRIWPDALHTNSLICEVWYKDGLLKKHRYSWEVHQKLCYISTSDTHKRSSLDDQRWRQFNLSWAAPKYFSKIKKTSKLQQHPIEEETHTETITTLSPS